MLCGCAGPAPHTDTAHRRVANTRHRSTSWFLGSVFGGGNNHRVRRPIHERAGANVHNPCSNACMQTPMPHARQRQCLCHVYADLYAMCTPTPTSVARACKRLQHARQRQRLCHVYANVYATCTPTPMPRASQRMVWYGMHANAYATCMQTSTPHARQRQRLCHMLCHVHANAYATW